MRKHDHVILKNENDMLTKRGIYKNCRGEVVDINGDKLKILFDHPRIHGNYAFVWINESDVEFDYRASEYADQLTDELLSKTDETKHTSLIEADVHEYDWVELIVEEEKYTKYGVHKGAVGCVIFDDSYDNKWDIAFVKPDGSGEDLAEICVAREDFKIIEHANIQ